MAHDDAPIPLSIDNTNDIPLAELVWKKSGRSLKTFNGDSVSTLYLIRLHPQLSLPFPLSGPLKIDKNIVKLRLIWYMPWQLEKGPVLLLALHSKSLPLFCMMMTLWVVGISVASTLLQNPQVLSENPLPKPRNLPFLSPLPNLHLKSTSLRNPRLNPKRNKLLPLFLLPALCQTLRLKI